MPNIYDIISNWMQTNLPFLYVNPILTVVLIVVITIAVCLLDKYLFKPILAKKANPVQFENHKFYKSERK